MSVNKRDNTNKKQLFPEKLLQKWGQDKIQKTSSLKAPDTLFKAVMNSISSEKSTVQHTSTISSSEDKRNLFIRLIDAMTPSIQNRFAYLLLPVILISFIFLRSQKAPSTLQSYDKPLAPVMNCIVNIETGSAFLINEVSGQVIQELYDNDSVPWGSIVRSGPLSRIFIKTENRSILLSTATELAINSYKSMEFLSGSARFQITPGTGPFTVDANASRITVLGTIFQIKQDSNRDLSVLLEKGRLSVNSSGKTTKLFAGQGTLIKQGGTPSNPFNFSLNKENDFSFDNDSGKGNSASSTDTRTKDSGNYKPVFDELDIQH